MVFSVHMQIRWLKYNLSASVFVVCNTREAQQTSELMQIKPYCLPGSRTGWDQGEKQLSGLWM